MIKSGAPLTGMSARWPISIVNADDGLGNLIWQGWIMAEFYSDFQMCEQCGTAICNASCRNSGTPNCRSSLFALGQYFFDAKEYSLGIPYLERVADRFRPAACKLIGDCYAKGLGIAVDINKAQEFYRLGGCHPNYYGPVIAKSNETKVLSASVSPVSSVPISKISVGDALVDPRYLQIQKETPVCVSSWGEVARKVVSFSARLYPERLKEIIDERIDGVCLETVLNQEFVYQFQIYDRMTKATAVGVIMRLSQVLGPVADEIKVWLLGNVVRISLRTPYIEREVVKKKVKIKEHHVKNVPSKRGRAMRVPKTRDNPYDRGREYPDSYAEKGIGFVARDNGRFGSLPVYDDMNE